MNKNFLLKSLVVEITPLNVELQENLIDEFEITKIDNSIHIDIVNLTIYVRFEVIQAHIELSIFENDILTVQILEDDIIIDCTLSSDFGIDQLFKANIPIEDLNIDIFRSIYSELLIKMREHILLYNN